MLLNKLARYTNDMNIDKIRPNRVSINNVQEMKGLLAGVTCRLATGVGMWRMMGN